MTNGKLSHKEYRKRGSDGRRGKKKLVTSMHLQNPLSHVWQW